ncbi:MAG: alpha-galactosidase [Eubacterium sp.]|nr:alpha-galactosidase [Eubacterium sp.]
MSIKADFEKNIFTIQTIHTTYQFMVDRFGYLLHLYYGRKTEGSMDYLLTFADCGMSAVPYDAGFDRTYSLGSLPLEYPFLGSGDFRSPAFVMRNADGTSGCDLRYAGYRIYDGKYVLTGLPAVYGCNEPGLEKDMKEALSGDWKAADGTAPDADFDPEDQTEESAGTGEKNRIQTLEIDLLDQVSGVTVTLLYGVLPDIDIITRAVKVTNAGKDKVYLDKVLSASMDFVHGSFDRITLPGRYALERTPERMPLGRGEQRIESRRGMSSHSYNPFLALAEPGTDENQGLAYAMEFVWSGSFQAEAGVDGMGQTRMQMGLSEDRFSYPVTPGESFYAPEVIMTCSTEGLSRMSQNLSDCIRYHVCRGPWKTKVRPVLINSWEAAYFDFTGKKLLDYASKAAELGIELFVMDDGWFGKRDNDLSGLGDWYVNEKKLGCSLHDFVEKIKEKGLKFGIWIEPEMISEDSDLYRAHPDWAFTIPGRKPTRSRYQLVLDFSRKDVRDNVFAQITKVLDSADISYVKWDYNRSITDVYSALAGQDQGRVLYDYMLGLYDFLEKIRRRYPDLLIEGCSGGGGRFDAGMLYYTPQIWCSDNTDALDRILIQYGTSFAYPVSAVGSHVSKCPNEQNGRTTPLSTRGIVAMYGSFGYELDPGALTEEEQNAVRKQIADFKKYAPLIQNGRTFRLTDPAKSRLAAWETVSRDGEEALVNVVRLQSHANDRPYYMTVKGLTPGAFYKIEGSERLYPADALMEAGLPVKFENVEYASLQLHLVRA